MTDYLVQEAASHRIDGKYHYTLEKWGKDQADSYIQGLFDAFAKIVSRDVLS